MLRAVLLLALALRVAIVFGVPYAIHPDEVFQYYEQAHRLVFGNGVVPWEFHDGVRSWLVPGLVAGIMEASRWFGPDPSDYLIPIRLLCSLLSLSVVYVSFRVGLRRGGLRGAAITGTLAAVWVDAVYFAPSLMSEVLSSYCALWAIELTDGERGDQRATVAIGALLGLAAALRPQYAPALLVVAVWHCRLDLRCRWLPLLGAGIVVVALDLGVLDFLTWGSPFHSVWQYIVRNVFQGFATQIGGDTPFFQYPLMVASNWTYLAVPMAVLAVIGAFRAPLLGAVAVTVVLSHSILGHKEYRFICLALMVMPLLMGIGATALLDSARRWTGPAVRAAAGAAIALYAAFASWHAWTEGPLLSTGERGDLQAFLAAHRQPSLCGLGVLERWYLTGGYTYLDRDVPIYYSFFPAAMPIKAAHVSIPQSVVLNNAPLTIYPDLELLNHTRAYNFLIAPGDRAVGEYTRVACFGNGSPSTPRICLLERPGQCQ